MKNIFLLCITFFLFSCKSQDKLKVNLFVEINSDELIDSISIYFFEQKKTYKKIKSKSKLNIDFYIQKEKIPKGETGIFSINVFKNGYFYNCTNGLIGFPTAQLYENYSFFIYNDYITTKKDFIPQNKQRKQNISEFKE